MITAIVVLYLLGMVSVVKFHRLVMPLVEAEVQEERGYALSPQQKRIALFISCVIWPVMSTLWLFTKKGNKSQSD